MGNPDWNCPLAMLDLNITFSIAQTFDKRIFFSLKGQVDKLELVKMFIPLNFPIHLMKVP